jgi:TonB-dependent starch-binding outer membrane protein SusC
MLNQKNPFIMKKVVFLFAVFVLSAGISMAQITIKGKVTSKKDNKPLTGAIVQAKEGKADVKTTTDAQGAYTLTISSEVKNIVISYNGLNSQTIGIGGRTIIYAALNSPADKVKNKYKSAKPKTATNKSTGK